MAAYIECNHESNAPFCHFGIHRNSNNELIGYLDFQDITEERAELSLSIPDKNYRNKHYGIDAVMVALKYAFETRNIPNIIVRTSVDNIVVKNICEKIGLKYEEEHFTGNGRDHDLLRYEINNHIYKEILSKLFGG
ncbi:MAG: GNAT family N-acetyltransferase [Treponema sp.]|nr:GNAT family N-acetyltransferase [Treponema sp.]